MLARARAHFLPAVVAVALAALAFERWRSSRVLFDDAFISFRYAWNLVHGHGLVYNAGERVEGYTNFLWVLLSTGVLAVGRDPIAVMSALGVVAYVATVGVVAWIAATASGSIPGRLAGIVVVSSLVLVRGYPAFAGSGLETSFVALLLVALGFVPAMSASPMRAVRALGAAVPLLLLLTRLDTAAAIVAAAAVFALDARRDGASRREIVSKLARWFGPAGAVLLAYLGWKLRYYGGLLPNTYYAKAADGLHFGPGVAYVRAFVQSTPSTLLLVVLVVGGLGARGARGTFVRYAAAAVALHAAYAVKVGGDFMEYRFMWEYWPVLVLGAAIAANALAARTKLAVLGLSALVAGTARFPTIYEGSFGMQSLGEMNGYAVLAERVGTGLARSLPPGTSVATTLAGTAYFMPDLITVDQWGLNDAFTARQKLERFSGRGHLKFAPLDYLRQRKVNLYMEHPVVCSCTNPCREGKPNVFVRLGEDQCVRTWYMTPTPELDAWVCAHPESFVLDGVTCR